MEKNIRAEKSKETADGRNGIKSGAGRKKGRRGNARGIKNGRELELKDYGLLLVEGALLTAAVAYIFYDSLYLEYI